MVCPGIKNRVGGGNYAELPHTPRGLDVTRRTLEAVGGHGARSWADQSFQSERTGLVP